MVQGGSDTLVIARLDEIPETLESLGSCSSFSEPS